MYPMHSKRRQFNVPSVEVAEELPPHIDNAIYRRLQSSIIYRCRCDFDLCADDLGQQTKVSFLGANRRSRIADYQCQYTGAGVTLTFTLMIWGVRQKYILWGLIAVHESLTNTVCCPKSSA